MFGDTAGVYIRGGNKKEKEDFSKGMQLMLFLPTSIISET